MLQGNRPVAILLAAFLATFSARCTPADGYAKPADTAFGIAVPTQSAPARLPAARSPASVSLVVAPTGNEARYRIREQLVQLPLPNDAVGRTTEVSGGIGLAADGSIIASESRFSIGIGSLTSDRDRRDNFVRRRVLEAEQHPTVEFLPTRITGLPRPLPVSGRHAFQIAGNLVIRGVSRPQLWQVTAERQGDRVTGTAVTAFTFADFRMEKPRVSVVLSVEDTIRLEYDFTLVPKS